ncbi:hypothetical protein [Mesorhizobium sp. M0118]|uniref:hypothetical protein n=1 Tax=Mesorhizobium sp. M0118 TaxID=2956884 RepID=UPI003337D242
MKHPYSFDHIRQKDGEPLTEWFVRVIGWAIAESKGREARIREALHTMEYLAYEAGQTEGLRKADVARKQETAKLHERIAELELYLRHSVSKIEAEQARKQAAIAMRNKASDRAEWPDGSTTPTSDAIDNLSLPRPIWTTTVRQK